MKIKILFLLTLMAVVTNAYSDSFILNPNDYQKTAIVSKTDDVTKTIAASELQKHLQLVTGYDFPIVKSSDGYSKFFIIGEPPASDTKKLAVEECRYAITANTIYIYGYDDFNHGNGNILLDVLETRFNKLGTLLSVYFFLENKLGIHWVESGDEGIAYKQMNSINLKSDSFKWISKFEFERGIRTYTWRYKENSADFPVIPKEMYMTEEQMNNRWTEDDIWQRRMRMGNRGYYLPFSHSFTQYWEKYGKEHPEYFALNGKGVRGPIEGMPIDRTKICPSSKGLIDQIVKDWLEARKTDPFTLHTIDATENDGGGFGKDEFCHCEDCMKMDFLKPGESFGANLTDRYVSFWNNILIEARKYDPQVVVCGFAYSITLTPPRKVRVSDGIVLEIVSRFDNDWSKTRAVYEGWFKMGAKKILFRPNDFWCEIGLPMGTEKRVFQHQQLAYNYGALGFDHDALNDHWNGISNPLYYIMGNTHLDMKKPFEYWENEYYSIFGNAKNDIKNFHQYWRMEVFDKRLYPANEAVIASGKRGILGWSSVRSYIQNIGKYYNENDFDKTDAFLVSALNKELTPWQRMYIKKMQLGNMHSRLTYRAMLAACSKNQDSIQKAGTELLDFRIKNKDSLKMNWFLTFHYEDFYGNVTGMKDIIKQHNK